MEEKDYFSTKANRNKLMQSLSFIGSLTKSSNEDDEEEEEKDNVFNLIGEDNKFITFDRFYLAEFYSHDKFILSGLNNIFKLTKETKEYIINSLTNSEDILNYLKLNTIDTNIKKYKEKINYLRDKFSFNKDDIVLDLTFKKPKEISIIKKENDLPFIPLKLNNTNDLIIQYIHHTFNIEKDNYQVNHSLYKEYMIYLPIDLTNKLEKSKCISYKLYKPLIDANYLINLIEFDWNDYHYRVLCHVLKPKE